MFEDSFLREVLLPIILIIIFVIALLSPIFYFSSYKESQVYNKINGTNYSASDFFWAGDQINNQTQTIKIK